MKHPKFFRSFEVASELPEALRPLKTLAMNFRWTWHSETEDLFRDLDRELFERVDRNPVELLARVDEGRIERLASDPPFMAKVDHCHRNLQQYLTEETWFDRRYPGRRGDTTIAYFCAEFGVSESLPIYSGGLGVLAGDHLKAASDLGIPLVAVGLLYSRGYFRQRLTHDGWQQETYPTYDFYQMPLKLVRDADQKALRIEVEFPDRVVTCQIWHAQVGRIPLYLLDSNVLENEPDDQGITDTLYGGDEEMRIRQEMILGIGGMRALRALGIDPTICHMNEGHAAFLSVERIRQFMIDHGADYRTARQVIVNGNVFTTHTPVPAGFDLFRPELLERYLGKTVHSLGLSFAQFLRLGRIDRESDGEAFNMAVLAMENANHVNGVSKLHAEVSRGMFQRRWPHYPEDEVPIEPITNGVHTHTWISRRMASLFDHHIGHAWRTEPHRPDSWKGVAGIPDEEIWQVREDLRGDLVRYVRRRLQKQYERRNRTRPDFSLIGSVLDPRVLTIGFARRFATYKRATLMLRERERLLRLLNHPERPIQILIAGKSHPRDDAGKQLIQELVRFTEESGAQHRMVFLEDYDMGVARALVHGVDVWLNNPRRPMEASGTSGMKVVPNGGLNCSVLDGWWDEAYHPGVGFAIGERQATQDGDHQDWLDGQALYQVLENEVASRFYHRVDGGVPREWVQMIKQSILELAPQFSTARMVIDYASRFYMPSADRYASLKADGLRRAQEALTWRDRLLATWPTVRVARVSDDAGAFTVLGQEFEVRAAVELGDLRPDEVRVQAIVGKAGPNRDLIGGQPCELEHDSSDGGVHTFVGRMRCDSAGYRGYVVRVVPDNRDLVVGHELGLVCWQRD
jgi:glycogen phosphorylase